MTERRQPTPGGAGLAGMMPSRSAQGLPPILRPGRWIVEAEGSSVALETRVCGIPGVRGRFTGLTGHVDLTPEPHASRLHITADTDTLSTGSAHRDRLLAATGLIDPDAGPTIDFRSEQILAPIVDDTRTIDGQLATERGSRPLRLALADPVATATGVRLHARGVIDRQDIAALLLRPAASRLLGPSARLELTVEFSAPEPDR